MKRPPPPGFTMCCKKCPKCGPGECQKNIVHTDGPGESYHNCGKCGHYWR